jgi:hypothetical protein
MVGCGSPLVSGVVELMERRTFLRALGTFATGLIVAPEILIPKTIFIPPAPVIVPSISTITATIAEYADFITVSSLLQDTELDQLLTAGYRNLGMRAALQSDRLVVREFGSSMWRQTIWK